MLTLLRSKVERVGDRFDGALQDFKHSLDREERVGASIDHFVKIVEMLVWADKNDQRIVDFFMENNLLQYFILLLERAGARDARREHCVALIKLFSFLLLNVKSSELLNLIYSHRVFNGFIKFPFDAFDEEVVVFYVSFLKSVAQKFDSFPLQIFYNRRNLDFPLYTQVTRFFAHPDSLVRATTFNTLLTILKGLLNSNDEEPRSRTAEGVPLQRLFRLLHQPPATAAVAHRRGGAAARLARGGRWALRLLSRVPQGALRGVPRDDAQLLLLLHAAAARS